MRTLLSLAAGFFGAIITILIVLFIDSLIHLLWGELFGIDTSAPQRTLIAPLIIIVGAFLVGIVVKAFGPTLGGLEEMIEEISENGSITLGKVPKTLFVAFISIASGGSLGPEAPSTVASAGGATIMSKNQNKKTKRSMGIASLIGMLVGFFILTFSTGGFGIPLDSEVNIPSLPWAFIFGLFGAILGIVVTIILWALRPLLTRLSKKPIHKALLGGGIFAILVIIFPSILFSGQFVLPSLISQSISIPVIVLIILSVAKLFSSQILLKTGFFGGPIFPALFAATSLGLALAIMTNQSEGMAIAAVFAGLLTIMTKKPLVAGLLAVAVTNLVAIPAIALGMGGSMLVLGLIKYFDIDLA